jgi:hypothetical protein
LPGRGGRDVVVTKRAEFEKILRSSLITESLPPPEVDDITTSRPIGLSFRAKPSLPADRQGTPFQGTSIRIKIIFYLKHLLIYLKGIPRLHCVPLGMTM